MGFVNHGDKRTDAMNLFVTSAEHLTDDDLAAQLGVHANTIGKWRREDHWKALRAEKRVTPMELATRVKRALLQAVDDIETAQREHGKVSPEYIKRLDYYSRILVRIDGWYDVKGSMLQWSQTFIEYLRARGEKEMLKDLNRALPEFYSFVESRTK